MSRLCVCVVINKRSFEPFMCLNLVCMRSDRVCTSGIAHFGPNSQLHQQQNTSPPVPSLYTFLHVVFGTSSLCLHRIHLCMPVNWLTVFAHYGPTVWYNLPHDSGHSSISSVKLLQKIGLFHMWGKQSARSWDRGLYTATCACVRAC